MKQSIFTILYTGAIPIFSVVYSNLLVMKKLLFFFLLSISIVACNPVATKQPADAKPLNYDSLKTVLLITDANFSDLSSKKGVHESFTTYIADDGAMLRPNRMPIISKDSLRVYFSNRPDTGYTLIWTPLFSDIS